MDLADCRRRSLCCQVRDPRLDVGMRDVDELHVRPSREYVLAKDPCVPLTSRRLEVRLPIEPPPCPFGGRDLALVRVDVQAGLHGGGDGVQPVLRVDLAGEVPRVLRAVRVAVPRTPLSVRTLRDVGHGALLA